MSKGPILILGAGPAGLAAAWRLARRGFEVTVAERGAAPGGNAASFEVEGQSVDYGSHRLHPSCAPEILADIRSMLGGDLLDRPRHGRIRLRGRWLHFPLKPADLLRNAPPGFALGALGDSLWKRAASNGAENFASVLERGLGRTICREFYFPYARKIWGVAPEELDAEQARRRVSAGSISGLARKILAPANRGRFYYPRGGFGRIAAAYAEAAEQAGARLLFRAPVTAIALEGGAVRSVSLGERRIEPRLTLSTIPLPRLAAMADSVPREVAGAASRLEYRAMILIYLALDTERFTEFDAHYFPSADIPITRLSEPKNYSLAGPAGRTVLCAELPCGAGDAFWSASDGELARLALDSLKRAGIAYEGRLRSVATRRLAEAYPIYRLGYRSVFEILDRWADQTAGLVTLGRQGLFAHDNTHHTLAMAYEAAACVGDDGSFDRARWSAARAGFEKFVVED
jgi:protoporphyrinogen oxidase